MRNKNNMIWFGIINKKMYLQNKEVKQNSYLRNLI